MQPNSAPEIKLGDHFHLADSPETLTGATSSGTPWAILCGDALVTLRTLPQESINCVVTSPPYFWLRDYRVQGQIGLEETVEDYVEKLSNVLDETRRVLRRDGLLFLNISDTYYSGKGESQGVDKKSAKRRFGLRAVDKSGGLGIARILHECS
ncbi:MAG: DNA methyltransferase [Gammaproteobacteria bacterium]|nr:DNA methyltransferase [Gammaproteobacteria bacterium]